VQSLEFIVESLGKRIITPEPIDLSVEPQKDAIRSLPQKTQGPNPFSLALSPIAFESPLADLPPPEQESYARFADAVEFYKGRILLLGEPGSGKTITLMDYAKKAFYERLNDPTKPLPLWGSIASWDTETKPSLSVWLARVNGLDPLQLKSEIEKGLTLLFLDGLDELVERDNPKLLVRSHDARENSVQYDINLLALWNQAKIRFLKMLQDLPSGNQVLLSSRLNEYKELALIGQQAALNGAVKIQPLSLQQIRVYLFKQPELLNLIESSQEWTLLAQSPLALSIFAYTYFRLSPLERTILNRLTDERDIRDRIFVDYIEQRYRHEVSRSRGLIESLKIETFRSVLGFLAAQMILKKSTELRREDRDFTQMSNSVQTIALAEQLGILVENEEHTLTFAHLLIRDTLAFGYIQPLIAKRNIKTNLRVNAFKIAESLADERLKNQLMLLFVHVLKRQSSWMVRVLGNTLLGPLIEAPLALQTEIIKAIAAIDHTKVVALKDELDKARASKIIYPNLFSEILSLGKKWNASWTKPAAEKLRQDAEKSRQVQKQYEDALSKAYMKIALA
jgi:hypothetical protein